MAPGRIEEAHAIARLLFAVTEEMRRSFGAVAADFDLTAPQARTLLRLVEPAPMRELAAHLACDASNVTGIADRLEERGLLERVPAPADRRVKVLTLTPQGRSLRAKLEAALLDRSPVMTGLTGDERRRLRELLQRAHGSLSST